MKKAKTVSRKMKALKREVASLSPFKGKTIKVKKIKKVKQTKDGKKADAKRDAKAPGLRVSKTGNRYTETRSNRAD